MKIRTISVDGFTVDVHDFGYAKYMYPSFNGDAEFSLSRHGFKKLRSYLRMTRWALDNLKTLQLL